MWRFAEQLFYATFDDHLRQTHGTPRATPAQIRIIRTVVKNFLLARKFLPDPVERDLVSLFGKSYGEDLSFEKVGPRGT